TRDPDVPGGYDVRAVDGRVRFRRGGDGEKGRFVETAVEGRTPRGGAATRALPARDRFPPLAEELDPRWPTRTQQSYPHAHEHVAQVFDHPAAPDVICLHTAAPNWEDHGGERGDNGGLGV